MTDSTQDRFQLCVEQIPGGYNGRIFGPNADEQEIRKWRSGAPFQSVGFPTYEAAAHFARKFGLDLDRRSSPRVGAKTSSA